MSATRTSGLLIAIALSTLASTAVAQGPWRRISEDREWTRGKAAAYCALYEPTTLISFQGSVLEVRYFSPGTAASQALMLIVELADGSELNVHLGPAWFASGQGVTFQIGDQVSVLGSRVTYRKKKIVVAAEITKGMSTLKLRDLDGVPLWRAPEPAS